MAEAPTIEQLLQMYRAMVLIRRMEEQAAKAYTLKKIVGFCHLYNGQEAVAVGASAALLPEDYVVAAYREHGHILARGADPNAVMAELMGRADGVTRGIGGSMHLSQRALNFFGGYGIVGGHVPLAAGAAFAAKYRDEKRVALCYFGDGAAQQGAFFEALELSQLWALPAVYLIENNYYAMGTALERQSFLTDMFKRAHGVGMEAWQFSGFDVWEVYENMKRAVEHARSGKGPVLVEAITYRYRGHSMSDPAKYRKEGELEEKKQRDPLLGARTRLLEMGVDEATLDAADALELARAKAAYEFALASPVPDPENLYAYTYAE